jgi:hypothetical protein
MNDPTAAPRPTRNPILECLSPAELERLQRLFQAVELEQGPVLYEARVPFEWV